MGILSDRVLTDVPLRFGYEFDRGFTNLSLTPTNIMYFLQQQRELFQKPEVTIPLIYIGKAFSSDGHEYITI